MNFDSQHLASDLDALDAATIDELPFGVIKLDAQNRVQIYSKAEARLSGFGTRPALGLDFFVSIAPCMNTAQFRGRIDEAMADGTLDLELGHTGDFADRARKLRARVVSADGGGVWIVMKRA